MQQHVQYASMCATGCSAAGPPALTWSRVLMSGDRPPCTHSTLPSINACRNPSRVVVSGAAVTRQLLVDCDCALLSQLAS